MFFRSNKEKLKIEELEHENKDLRERLLQATLQLEKGLLFNEINQQLFRSLPYIIFWRNQDKVILGGNEYFLSLTGVNDLNELRGKKVHELKWKELLEISEKFDSDVLESFEMKRFQSHLVLRNGDVKMMEITKLPLIDTKGNVVGLLNIMEDITRRLSDENLLNKTVNELKLLGDIISNSSSLAFVFSSGTRWSVSFVSKNIAKLGYSPEEFYSGKYDLKSIIYPEDVTAFENRLSLYTHDISEKVSKEFRLITRNGGIIWVKENIRYIKNIVNGKSYYESILTDISELKDKEGLIKTQYEEIQMQNEEIQAQNEEFFAINEELKNSYDELYNLHNKLGESEEKFRIIAEQSLIGLLMIKDQKIRYINPTMNNIFEFDKKEHDSFSIDQYIKQIHKSDRAIAKERIYMAIDDKISTNCSYKIETPIGEIKYIEQYTRIVILDSEKVIMISCVDISKRKFYEEAIKEVNNYLSATLNSINDALLTFNTSGRIIRANRSAELLLKMPFENFRNKRVDLIIKLTDLNDHSFNLKEQINTSLTKGDEFYDESVFRLNFEGYSKNVGITIMPIKDENDIILGGIMDIREIKDSKPLLSDDFKDIRHGSLKLGMDVFKTIFDYADDGICLINEKGRVVEWNKGFEKLTGLKHFVVKDEYVWHLMYMLNKPEKRSPVLLKKFEALFGKFYSNPKDYIYNHFEIQLFNLQKESILLKAVLFPIEIEGNQLFGIIAKNITDIKKAENELKRHQRFLQTILDNSPVAIYIKNTNAEFQLVNSRAEEVFGVKRDVLLNKKLQEVIVGVDKNGLIAESDELVLKENKTIRIEEKLLIDGRIRTFISIKAPFVGYQGEENGILGILMDITDRQETEMRLRESEELYKKLVNTTPNSILVSDIEGKIIFASPKAIDIFGLNKVADITTSFLFQWVYKEDRESLLSSMTELINKGVNLGNEFRFLRKDASVFNGEISSAVIDNYLGRQNAIISVIRNIDERKTFEQELIKAKEKAEESDKLKSAFLANMSHEIRTPMNAIVGFSSLLIDDDLPKDKKEEYFEIINNNSNNLLAIINDVLDIAKIEAGQIKIVEGNCKLDNLLIETKNLFDDYLLRKNKDVKIILDEKSLGKNIIISIDSIRFQQILNNLLSNAIKFTEKGYVKFGYEFVGDSYLKFFVEDSGIGIQKDKQELIFDRFRQADEDYTKVHGGAGLGLSISKSLVRLMGGEIWLDSEPEKGSTFWFTLPYSKGVDVTTDMTKLKGLDLKQQNLLNGKKILVVEDEVLNFRFLKDYLEKSGASIVFAENGQDALSIFNSLDKPDLILMDIKMPVMDGLETTREIRRSNNNIPIIAVTAFAQEDDKNKCLLAGCNDFISKPINLNDLIFKILKYLD